MTTRSVYVFIAVCDSVWNGTILISLNFFNKKVCHCIDDRHRYFSFLTHHKGKNT